MVEVVPAIGTQMKTRSRIAVAACSILWLLITTACGGSGRDGNALSAPTLPSESVTFDLLDGSVLAMTAPVGALGTGTTSHTVVSHGDIVVTVETGDKSFGTGWLAEISESQTEPYWGGELISGMLNGPRALIWIGNAHSLLLAYDSISPEDARALLDSLDLFEDADGIVAKSRVGMHGTTVTVPLTGGAMLELSPNEGPANKELRVEQGSDGEVTAIFVAYPTANAAVYVPPAGGGAALVDLVENIDVRWDSN